MKTNSLLIAFLLFFTLTSFGQEDEFNQFKEEASKEFSDFDKKNQEVFNNFVEKNDKEFANFLRKAWNEYDGKEPKKPKLGEKPEKRPTLKSKEKKRAENMEERSIVIKKTTQVVPLAVTNRIPPIQKKETVIKNKSAVSISFYGLKADFLFDPNLKNTLSKGSIAPDLIADFWEAASDCNHYNLVNDLMEFKIEHKLNDWAYYQLIGKLSSKISNDNKNQAKLLKWFLLIKSRYDTKVGYNSNSIYVMVASEYMIFSKNYFSFDNINYFILDDDNVKSLRSYPENYPDAKTKLNFRVDQAPLFGKNIKSRNLKFDYLSNKYNLKLNYNKSNIDFYNTIPQLDLPVYFNAGSSSELSSSIIENLKPLTDGMDEFTAVSFLLKFAQTSFDYKTDPQQFGYEKFFFAEETVFYPYSDCEDRSVFFASLIQQVLGLEVVGLEYPGHVATAIKFSDNRKGDHLFYKGDKYIICDPTYINAPVGMCMPQFINIQAIVIPLSAENLKSSYQDEIRSTILSAGGETKEDNISLDSDGNIYVSGTYDQSLIFKEAKLEANDQQVNAFVAKFNKKKELIWASKISGDSNLQNDFVKINSDNSTYISGTIGTTAQFGEKLISTKVDNLQVFIAKYDEYGELAWVKTSAVPKEANEKYIYVAKYSNSGEEVSSMLFEKNKGFNNYGISFSSKGDIVLTIQLK